MARPISHKLIIAGVLVASLILGISFYQIGYSNGNKDGYRSGYQNGVSSDNKTAWHDGYIDGYKNGAEYTFMDMSCLYLCGTRLNFFSNYNNSAWNHGWDRGIEEMVGKCSGADKYSYITRDIELDKLQRFLYLDETDSIAYSEDFNCLGYAFMLKINAAKQGIRCAVVILYYINEETGKNDIGHAINAFKILDKSIIYVEPQTDDIIDVLKAGDSYRRNVFQNRGKNYYYEWLDNGLKLCCHYHKDKDQ